MKQASKVVKIFKSFEDQEVWDIQYYINLRPDERQRIARELRKRYYGKNPPRIRDAQASK
jgi:hypothetical protein